MLRPRLLVLVCVGGLLHLGAVMAGAVVVHDHFFGADADAVESTVEDGEEAPLADDTVTADDPDDTDAVLDVELPDDTTDASDTQLEAPSFGEHTVVLPVDIVSLRCTECDAR